MTTACQVWGILNTTPDSFSDGGRFLDADAAIKHGLEMAADGASVIDVGGESTRPGAQRISVTEELDRVLPVISGLVAAGLTVSIDTMRAEVAVAAVGAGASVVNDVSGGLADRDMHAAVAELGVDYVLMHWRGQSAVMDDLAKYGDVVGDVRQELTRQTDRAMAAGIASERIVLDPGLGFAKQAEHNWELLRRMPELTADGRRWLVGASRKRFLAECVADGAGDDPAARDAATASISFYCANLGVWAVRVHDVAGSVAAVRAAGEMAKEVKL